MAKFYATIMIVIEAENIRDANLKASALLRRWSEEAEEEAGISAVIPHDQGDGWIDELPGE